MPWDFWRDGSCTRITIITALLNPILWPHLCICNHPTCNICTHPMSISLKQIQPRYAFVYFFLCVPAFQVFQGECHSFEVSFSGKNYLSKYVLFFVIMSGIETPKGNLIIKSDCCLHCKKRGGFKKKS